MAALEKVPQFLEKALLKGVPKGKGKPKAPPPASDEPVEGEGKSDDEPPQPSSSTIKSFPAHGSEKLLE
jgi:hypothetical protein